MLSRSVDFKAPVRVLATLLALLSGTPAFAQSTSSFEGLSLSQVLTRLGEVAGAVGPGQAIAVSTALEVATAPLGTSSAGFVFRLDPATGLRVRTATTFGPSFGERVLTAGEGKINIAANLAVATYDRLGSSDLDQMQLSRVQTTNPATSFSGVNSLVLSSQTMLLHAAIGATDSLDFLVAIPLVKVKLEGLAFVETGDGKVPVRSTGSGIASGLGDMAVQAKYRLLKFGEGEPDPGGLAVIGTMRLPTGDPDNLRGLGITRVMASLVVSSGRGRFRPHANGGFEVWTKGVQVGRDELGQPVEARHQIQYAAGVELEAAPKVTLILDAVGRHLLGGGRIESRSFPPELAGIPSVTSIDAMIPTQAGVRKISLAPGLKWNVKGTVLLSLNALIPVLDNGLYDRFTPVVGLDWTF